MTYLAKHMKETYDVPFKQVSYFGIEDMSAALYEVAAFFGDSALHEKAAVLVRDEVSRLLPMIESYRAKLEGRKAVIYVGGAFKTISLIKALRLIGIETVVAGSQTGRPEDYDTMASLCKPGTIIVDDSNPVELSTFARERGADLFIGGVKERPIAFKLGMAFCDHNHERKLPLAGFEGMRNFAEEVYGSVMTPVWQSARGRRSEVGGQRSEVRGQRTAGIEATPNAERRTPNAEGVDARAEATPHSSLLTPHSVTAAAKPSAVTVNPCKVCAPLGACVAFRGVEGCIPLIHGSQGCATYIRRYTISHFREPMDIASSSFVESATVFGGNALFSAGLDNIIRQYNPLAIGICTSCLSETIGDDVALFLREYKAAHTDAVLPALIHASTPSYKGTHMDGFHAAVRAILACTVKERGAAVANQVTVLPGFVSPADLRYLKDTLADFGLEDVLVPDYSETLDGPSWEEYHRLPEGGTPVERISASANSVAVLQFGRALQGGGGDWLEETFGTPCRRLGLPIGLRESDALFDVLEEISGRPVPRRHAQERGRLLDSFVDGHKYLFGKRAVVYGEEDLVIGLASLLNEIGINPVLCATGGISGAFKEQVAAVTSDAQRLFPGELEVLADTDHDTIFTRAEALRPDLVIGNSKGYKMARKLGVPLVRVGFPIHDRLGGQRQLHLGYRGTQNLFDLICNALMGAKQDTSPIGFMYV
jgi:nitrogenase molybdenum-iron protein NifN